MNKTDYPNWRCFSYRVVGIPSDFSYQELKSYFALDGSQEVDCIKDLGGVYRVGDRCRVCEGAGVGLYNVGYVICKKGAEEMLTGKEQCP